MSNYAARHDTHYPRVEGVARQKNAESAGDKKSALRRASKKRPTHTTTLLGRRRAKHVARMAQLRIARAEVFARRCCEQRRAKEGRLARHKELLRCVVRSMSATVPRNNKVNNVEAVRARYKEYLIRCMRRGKRGVFVPDYINQAQVLRESCEGRHGKTFRSEGVPGFWTFLHSVPDDPSRAVFRDPAGISQIRSYSELAPHLRAV